MKAIFGQETVESWKVTRDEAPDFWVQDLINKNQLVWKKDANGSLLRVPALEEAHKGEFLGELAALRLGGIGNIIARIGDYLVRESDGTLKVISEKRFLKDYHVVN